MNVFARFFLLVLPAIIGASMAAAQNVPGPAVNDDPVALDSEPVRVFFINVRQFLNQEDFDQLEKIAGDVRTSKARFTGGDWTLQNF